MTGVTPQGFERPSFEEIRADIVAEFRAVLGPVNTGPESAVGQQIAIMAEREALLWEGLEATYHSQYPDTAKGRSLDGAVQLTGITRLDATRTTVAVQFAGDPGTVIPAGSEASTNDGDLFSLVVEVTLDGSGEGEGQMQAVETGEVLALAGTLVNIETPVSGWDTITNATDGEEGRNAETDPQLRARRAQSLQVAGAGTVPAIRARLLQQVDDVTAVTIIENRNDTVDGQGRPPHSFETVVSGGTDQDVADLLWEVKPAGIETTGEITSAVEDSQGVNQTIRFSRPIQRFVWLKVDLQVDGTGEFPDNAEQATKDALVAFGETLSVGDDVLYQALFGPIYRNIPGIDMVTLTVAVNSDAGTEPD
ncbi:MAG: baseplate J/gp47 family protein, partial [Spiribacter salinus]